MNIAVLTGNLTRDPEFMTTQSGVALCKFSIAVQRKYSDANGEKSVDFFDCVAWRQTAEFCHKHLKKGKRVTVSGSLATNEYTANDGAKRKNINVVVDDVDIAFTKAINEEQDQKINNADLTPVDEDDLPF
ncbi:MAG: single-stranded DNA-binding protein [Clostridia bacterium]|nr:single-stranded DNA-binding protein [Clostridia bacterium]